MKALEDLSARYVRLVLPGYQQALTYMVDGTLAALVGMGPFSFA